MRLPLAEDFCPHMESVGLYTHDPRRLMKTRKECICRSTVTDQITMVPLTRLQGVPRVEALKFKKCIRMPYGLQSEHHSPFSWGICPPKTNPVSLTWAVHPAVHGSNKRSRRAPFSHRGDPLSKSLHTSRFPPGGHPTLPAKPELNTHMSKTHVGQ
jgi:hypothetical protein